MLVRARVYGDVSYGGGWCCLVCVCVCVCVCVFVFVCACVCLCLFGDVGGGSFVFHFCVSVDMYMGMFVENLIVYCLVVCVCVCARVWVFSVRMCM